MATAEQVELLRAAVPDDPFFGCCSEACYDCSLHPGHYSNCTWAALDRTDRQAPVAAMSQAQLDAVAAHLRDAVAETPYVGMCTSYCMACYADDPDHKPDCAWVAAQPAMAALSA